jgi:fumarate hydratase, class I
MMFRHIRMNRCTNVIQQLLPMRIFPRIGRYYLSSLASSNTSPTYTYTPLFQSNIYDDTNIQYKQLAGPDGMVEAMTMFTNGISQVPEPYLFVNGIAIQQLTKQAFSDVAHLLRPAHLQQLSNILNDTDASQNDRFVAMELLKNANIASSKVLPGCQDTGTAIIMGKKGHTILTDGLDESYISTGVHDTYQQLNLRYSQVASIDMFTEKNTNNNMPAQIDLYSTFGNMYKFLFIAKGGGSANKTFLYQQTKAVLNTGRLEQFLHDQIKTIGTSACPPYHLAIVIGGLSAEMTLKTVKLASTKFYDDLPTTGNLSTGHAYRDLQWESHILQMTQQLGIGAQFGGKYFCHDIRVIRLPRHGASCPIGIGVSCSADRQVLGKINKDGIFLEQLCEDVTPYLPDVTESSLNTEMDVVHINMNEMTMTELRSKLSHYPIRTRLSLTGTIVVARDIAHAKLLHRIESGQGLPDYFKNYIIYYAGPAKTPQGYASGSFGPSTFYFVFVYYDFTSMVNRKKKTVAIITYSLFFSF